MQKTDLKEWWVKTGCKELNKVLIEFIGLDLGFIPLVNLCGDFCDISVFDQDELVALLMEDGCFVRTQLLSSGETIVLVYVK